MERSAINADMGWQTWSAGIASPRTPYLISVRQVNNSLRYHPSSLSVYVGTYYSPELDVQYGIIEVDGTLTVKRTSFDDPKPVHVYAKNALRTSIGEFRLAIDKEGTIKEFTLNAGRVKNIKFRKIK
jgi:hypothetical protein